MTQSDLVRKTGIRAASINEYYHELTPRINLDHFDRICEALDCDLGEIIVRISKKDPVPRYHRK